MDFYKEGVGDVDVDEGANMPPINIALLPRLMIMPITSSVANLLCVFILYL